MSTVINWIPDNTDDYIACLAEMKVSHNIPHSYCHAMTIDLKRWMQDEHTENEAHVGFSQTATRGECYGLNVGIQY